MFTAKYATHEPSTHGMSVGSERVQRVGQRRATCPAAPHDEPRAASDRLYWPTLKSSFHGDLRLRISAAMVARLWAMIAGHRPHMYSSAKTKAVERVTPCGS